MFEHPESVARAMRERYEERAERGARLQATRRELGMEPRWRHAAAVLLHRLADRLDGSCRQMQAPASARTEGR
ncbi:MAG: hypothetical protein C0506_11360 [Anaerolinea sp.]|nr:hypothetical protein [Anaerolinea sp.]